MVEEQNFSIWENIGSGPDKPKKRNFVAAAAGAAADWIYCFFDFFWKFGMAILRLFEGRKIESTDRGSQISKKREISDIELVELSAAKLSFRKETEESDVAELRALRGSGFDGPAGS